ncbi:MAG: helix-turn-helix domain-containing protein [Opitutaceae bacterium]|nr:helix-turn-helix domain-containing protein [Opitutaceae bacterium]
MKSLHSFLAAARRLPLARKTTHRIDPRGEYQHTFSPEFPFEITRILYPSNRPAQLLWHTYFEIFILLSSECRRQMGNSLITLRQGDLLVMDHLKLHRVSDFPGDHAEALVIRFLPDVVRSPGMVSDHTLLLPFHCHPAGEPNLLRANDPAAPACRDALVGLLENYRLPEASDYRQTGARGYFLVLLHHLARHFGAAEKLRDMYARQHAITGRLRRVFEHINQHYAEPLTLPAMAAMANLSRQRFNRVFKNAAGMTLIEYVAHVRVTHAARLLRETDRSIAEIASALGFADQSHFDRRFRRHYGRTPRQFRLGVPGAPTAAAP